MLQIARAQRRNAIKQKLGIRLASTELLQSALRGGPR
jgi:hypothetical protein